MEKNKYALYSNILALVKDLRTEKDLKDYLAFIRWGEKPQCVHCNSDQKIYKYSLPGIYECGICNKRFSVLQGTIFERSPIPIDIWLWNIFEFCSGITPSTTCADRYTIEQKTAYLMNMRIRHTLWEELNTILSGTIYCDETELGADPQKDLRVFHDKRTRKKKGLPSNHYMNVFGMLEEGKGQKAKPKNKQGAIKGGRLILLVVDDKKLDTIQREMIRRTDSYNSTFITDGARSYYDFRFWCQRHYVLNKSGFRKYDFNKHVRKINKYSLELANEIDILAGNFITLTNNPIENVWSKLSLDYRRYYGFSKEYAQMYLNEFMFRWNHQHLNNGERFLLLLQRCLNTPLYSGFGKDRKKLPLK